jgi:hypothetical protein
MESLNLNGRVVGRTAGGRILVELTVEEYLESLPVLDPATAPMPAFVQKMSSEIRKHLEIPDVEVPATLPAKHRGGRPRGKATPAQRAFNGQREKSAKAAEERTCPHCKGKYTPGRKDQTNCLSAACREKQKQLAGMAARAGKAKLAKPTPAATVAPAVDRIAAIKAAQARVAARQAPGEQPIETKGADREF